MRLPLFVFRIQAISRPPKRHEERLSFMSDFHAAKHRAWCAAFTLPSGQRIEQWKRERRLSMSVGKRSNEDSSLWQDGETGSGIGHPDFAHYDGVRSEDMANTLNTLCGEPKSATNKKDRRNLHDKPCQYKQPSIFSKHPFPLKDVILPFLIAFVSSIAAAIAVDVFGTEDYTGIFLSTEIAVVAGFFYCYSKGGKPNSALLRFSFMLLLILAVTLCSDEIHQIWSNDFPAKKWYTGVLLWSGVIIYGLCESIFNWLRNRRREACLYQIVAWNKRRDMETNRVLPIRADDGDAYAIVSLDNEKQIAINIDCRPTKQGCYKCAWVWNDPTDGKHYFLTPDNYEILFSFVTGNIEIQGLNDGNNK